MLYRVVKCPKCKKYQIATGREYFQCKYCGYKTRYKWKHKGVNWGWNVRPLLETDNPRIAQAFLKKVSGEGDTEFRSP